MSDLFFISKDFINAVKKDNRPSYKIAAEANVSPPLVSRAINGREVFEKGDERIHRIAKVIGYTGEIFETNPARLAERP